ncbi:MAG TPA: hypothetical protein V6D00_04315 [Pantanalinema sp.]
MTKRFFSLLALTAALVPALAAPASAAAGWGKGLFGVLPAWGPQPPEQMARGPLHFSMGAQQHPVHGMVGSALFSAVGPMAEGDVSLVASQGFINHFVAGAGARFVGQTGLFLPLNLMPVMGIEGAMYMTESTPGANTDVGVPILVPLGLRYSLPIGIGSVSAEATYHRQIYDVLGGKSDFSRVHYELSLRLGGFSVAAFRDDGGILAGPGARIGMNF